MDPGSVVCRSAVHPKYILGDVFDPSILFSFSLVEEIGARASSVTSKDIAGGEAEVHDAGRVVAAKANEREAIRKRNNPDYEVKDFFYLAFYDVAVSEISEIVSDYHRVELNWRPEDGSDAHFQIEIYEQLKPPTKGAGKSDRRTIISQLSDLLVGPCLCPKAALDDDLKMLQIATLPKLGV